MLDIKLIREKPEWVKERLAVRCKDYGPQIDEIADIDRERRAIIAESDALKQRQNAASREIPRIKQEGGDVKAIMAEMKEISEKVKGFEKRLGELEEQQKTLLLNIPNTPNETVPPGEDSSDNIEQRHWGEPTVFDFDAKPHWELGANLGILDPERAAKVTGARFHFYKGLGASLERAVMNFYLDLHIAEHGYTEMFPPFMANRASMTGTGQLPKFEEDMFHLANEDYFLIPTAE
ncbi:MAG: serine--tRNA ligase, partial [Oscillospiraceae bacterium]|nr:serine--tRNA ligase [Oscillospiraceae bacterium]